MENCALEQGFSTSATLRYKSGSKNIWSFWRLNLSFSVVCGAMWGFLELNNMLLWDVSFGPGCTRGGIKSKCEAKKLRSNNFWDRERNTSTICVNSTSMGRTLRLSTAQGYVMLPVLEYPHQSKTFSILEVVLIISSHGPMDWKVEDLNGKHTYTHKYTHTTRCLPNREKYLTWFPCIAMWCEAHGCSYYLLFT